MTSKELTNLKTEVRAFILKTKNLPKKIQNNIRKYYRSVQNNSLHTYREQFEKIKREYENFLKFESELKALLNNKKISLETKLTVLQTKNNPHFEKTKYENFLKLKINIRSLLNKNLPPIIINILKNYNKELTIHGVHFYKPLVNNIQKNFLNFKPKGHKQLLENIKLPIYTIYAHGLETGELFKLDSNQWVIFTAPSKCSTYTRKIKNIDDLLKSRKGNLFSTIAPYDIKGPGSIFIDISLEYRGDSNYILKNNVEIKNRPGTLGDCLLLLKNKKNQDPQL